MKIIFLHIVKTGGGTFSEVLKHLYDDYYRFEGAQTELRILKDQSPSMRSLRTKVTAGHFRFLPEYRNHFLCTFIRHPIDWAVSRFLHSQQYSNLRKFKTIRHMMDKGYVNIQSEWLKGSKITDFSFIGITDRYIDSDLRERHRSAKKKPLDDIGEDTSREN